MKKVTIYTLVGCSYCERFKNNLDENNLIYKEISCADQSKQCSELEELSNCDLYPMCKIETDSGTILLTMPDDYSQIGKVTKLENNKRIIFVHSIDNMLQFVKNA